MQWFSHFEKHLIQPAREETVLSFVPPMNIANSTAPILSIEQFLHVSGGNLWIAGVPVPVEASIQSHYVCGDEKSWRTLVLLLDSALLDYWDCRDCTVGLIVGIMADSEIQDLKP